MKYLIFTLLLIGCKERSETPDENQLKFFKQQIEINKQLNKIQK